MEITMYFEEKRNMRRFQAINHWPAIFRDLTLDQRGFGEDLFTMKNNKRAVISKTVPFIE